MSLWPRTVKIFISNWSRTRKFGQFFKNTEGEDLFFPWLRVDHALRPIFILWLVKIWQVSSCRKFMQHLESCLLWQLKLTEFCVKLWCFLTVFFHWMYKMRYSCSQESSVLVCYSWLVCLLGFWLINASLVKIRYPSPWSRARKRTCRKQTSAMVVYFRARTSSVAREWRQSD